MIDYFHQVDDPYSHLAAQALGPLAARYGVEVRCWLAPPPDDAAAPERGRLNAYARRDAPRVAAAYGLAFPADATAPAADAVMLAQRILAAAPKSAAGFGEAAVAVGEALWRGDRAALQALATGAASAEEAAAAVAAGAEERARLGHYLGAMFHHDGAWFWGVDRLSYLEAALAGQDSQAGAPPIAPWRDMRLGPPPAGGKPATVEMWFSFRSPYSWIAVPRVRQLAKHYGARLELRPILPMVMRGLPVPPVKSLYIVRDVFREAQQVGLPFGRIVDPVGAGAERALAVLCHVAPLGLGEDFAESALRGAWSEAIALASDEGLIAVATRAGLTEAQVRAALADESWRATAEVNRAALFDAGLWGAPTYRVNGGPAHWGQDRLWTLEEDLVAAMAA
jgi:2-hydroxychromene-2-carboxylate isomerase